ncbi:hypothetical protein JIN84_20875 [Luteolibacter yonseiensis]|uniref:Uncharacterized protein n=1 Tax=Luteolibacter yonseiensis TaxID=1144680 RepID=A0A934RAN4_9BACT|nr:hypothetical protein [Luteolibacter yonseiensis]MBK1818089.1 hypothetical protein [Luteolibacter yonseiensis]
MKTLLHTPLGENQDESVANLVRDLCGIRNRRISDYDDYTLFNFLEVVVKEDSKSLSSDHLAAPMILDQKLGKLQDLGIYSVCKELNNGDTLEAEAGTILVKFLKKRFTAPASSGKSAEVSAHDLDVRIIQQRRRNAY